MDKTNKRGGGWGTYSNTPECILGRRHPLSTCCFPFKEIYGQMNFGTFFTVLRKDITWRSTTFFFFFFCGSSSYVCVLEAPPLLHMRKMSEQLGFLASPDASPSLCQKMQLTEWSPGTATPACINALWDPLTYTIHIHFSARFLWGSFLCLGTVLPLCLQPTPLFWWWW